MERIAELVFEIIFYILRIVFEIYLLTKFFLRDRKEFHTLWYGIACIILLIC